MEERTHKQHRCIVQDAIVDRVTETHVEVRIHRDTACGACRARTLCPGAESGNTLISAVCDFNPSPGEPVRLEMAERHGFLAVLLGFVAPLLIVLSVFFGLESNLGNEALAGVSALAVLVPYYLCLYLFRNHLTRHIVFIATKPTL